VKFVSEMVKLKLGCKLGGSWGAEKQKKNVDKLCHISKILAIKQKYWLDNIPILPKHKKQ